jgi:ABC-type polysaccharide/polyol phosphate export permease
MFRDVVMYDTVPPLSEHLICLAVGAAAIIVGFMVMRRNRDRITTLV